jgi:hypothetical protein
MKTLFISTTLLLLGISVNAKLVRYCQVSYKNSNQWSRTKVIEILFLTGKELITKTGDENYNQSSVYCVVLNEKNNENGDDVVELDDPLLAVGDTFDEEDFVNAYRFKPQLDGTQTVDNQRISWKITGKEDDQFVHAIEEKNNRKKHLDGVASRNNKKQQKEIYKPEEE